MSKLDDAVSPDPNGMGLFNEAFAQIGHAIHCFSALEVAIFALIVKVTKQPVANVKALLGSHPVMLNDLCARLLAVAALQPTWEEAEPLLVIFQKNLIAVSKYRNVFAHLPIGSLQGDDEVFFDNQNRYTDFGIPDSKDRYRVLTFAEVSAVTSAAIQVRVSLQHVIEPVVLGKWTSAQMLSSATGDTITEPLKLPTFRSK